MTTLRCLITRLYTNMRPEICIYFMLVGGKLILGAIYNSNDNSAIGFIRSEVDVACPEMVNPGNWMYYDDNMDHSTISVT